MTTIAYKAGVMAADTMVSQAGMSFDSHATKILLRSGYFCAGAGNYVMVQEFMDWFRAGMPEGVDLFISRVDASPGQGIIITPDETIIYFNDQGVCRSQMARGMYAIGSGSDYAMGAMMAGAEAQEAVEIAARVDHCTGGPITVLVR